MEPRGDSRFHLCRLRWSRIALKTIGKWIRDCLSSSSSAFVYPARVVTRVCMHNPNPALIIGQLIILAIFRSYSTPKGVPAAATPMRSQRLCQLSLVGDGVRGSANAQGRCGILLNATGEIFRAPFVLHAHGHGQHYELEVVPDQ